MTELFAEQAVKCELLRDMIHALESENVRRVMAEWQKDAEAGPPADIKVLDQVPPVRAVVRGDTL